MIKTGFYDVALRKEAERRAIRRLEEQKQEVRIAALKAKLDQAKKNED